MPLSCSSHILRFLASSSPPISALLSPALAAALVLRDVQIPALDHLLKLPDKGLGEHVARVRVPHEAAFASVPVSDLTLRAYRHRYAAPTAHGSSGESAWAARIPG